MTIEAVSALAQKFLHTIHLPVDKILAVEPASHAGFQVHIQSDGMSLDDKISCERDFHLFLKEVASDFDIRLYFRRLSPAPAMPQQRGPQSVPKDRIALGINIEHRKSISGVKRILAVASGKGGVGKSTVSTLLAGSLSKLGKKVGLLDADLYGPSSPLMLGLKGPLEISPRQKLIPKESAGIKSVSFGYLSDAYSPVMWRGPLISKALKQFLFEVEWGELDVLILDLPPGTGDIQMTLAETLQVDGTIVVTTPQRVARIDAHKALSMMESLEVPVLGVLENMAYHECTHCRHQDYFFGQGGGDRFARERSVPLLGSLPMDPRITALIDEGEISKILSEDFGQPFLNLARNLLHGSFFVEPS